MLWQLFRRGFGAKPGHDAVARRGAPISGAPDSRKSQDDSTLATRFEAGLAHQRAHRLADAESCYRGVLGADLRHAPALYHLSLILCADGRLAEAAHLCGRANECDPGNADYLACARFAHANAGLSDSGSEGSILALEDRANSSGLAADWVALGNARRQSGAFDEAEAAYGRAVAAGRAKPFAHARLGNLLAVLGRHDEAQPHLDIAAKAGLMPEGLARLDAGFFQSLHDRRGELARAAPLGDWGDTSRACVVFMSCDVAYFDRFAHALVNSLRQNGRIDCLVHIHVVNPDAGMAAKVDRLRKALPGIDIVWSFEAVDLAAYAMPKTYYACSRFLHLPALARRYDKPLLVLYMDMLVMRRLDGLLDSIAGMDAALIEYDRGRNDIPEHFWASVLYAGTSPSAVSLFDDVALYIAHFLDSGRPVWFLDQVALFAAHAHAARSTHPPRVRMLPGSLCHTSMKPDDIPSIESTGEETLFWSITYSVPENAAKLQSLAFARYAATPDAAGQQGEGFNRVKACRHGTLIYNINDQYIGRALHEYAEFSQGEADLFAKIIQPGQVVVDAGANIGAHTVFFCRAVGPKGVVHAFEPQRVIFQTLCANLALNSLQNGHAHHAALGDEPGSIMVDVPDYSQPNNFGGMPLGAFSEGERVPLVTIDSLGLAACHFMKIDVEGMEQAVIRGAAETIRRHRPVLYVENDREEHARALVAQLEALGYRLHWHLPAYFNPDNFAHNPKNVFGNIASRNMLCLPAKRVQLNEWPDFGLPLVDEASLPPAAAVGDAAAAEH